MKIAVSTVKGGLDDIVSPQFGRAQTFTIVEVEGNEIKDVKVIQNPFANGASGVGIRVAEMLINEGCQVLISGNVGPNSFQVLQAGNVDVRQATGITVREAVMRYLENKLPTATPIQSGQGFGMGRGMGKGMGRGRRGWI